MADSRTTLTPREARLYGLIFIAVGVFPMLAGLGVVHAGSPAQSPPWVVFLVGMIFVLGGCCIIVTYGAGAEVDADGNIDPNAPFGLQAAQLVFVLLVVISMATVQSWIAFGPGERTFSTTISWPFGVRRTQGNSTSGRIAFGAGACLSWLIAVLMAKQGIRRLVMLRSKA